LHNVLRALLHERVPVRDIVTILETLANYAGTGAGTDTLSTKVREVLHRTITSQHTEPDGKLYAISLHPGAEQTLVDACRQSEQHGQVVLDPAFTQDFMRRLDGVLRQAYSGGRSPVLLVPTVIRFFLKRLIEPTYPNLAVMGYTEVAASAQIQSAGTVVTHGHAQQQASN
jgi:flagellar biosynthesis protein FlhA